MLKKSFCFFLLTAVIITDFTVPENEEYKFFLRDLKFELPLSAIEWKIKNNIAKCSWDIGPIKSKVSGASVRLGQQQHLKSATDLEMHFACKLRILLSKIKNFDTYQLVLKNW